jgi:hypothetical protein
MVTMVQCTFRVGERISYTKSNRTKPALGEEESMKEKHIFWFDEIGKDANVLVGKKCQI